MQDIFSSSYITNRARQTIEVEELLKGPHTIEYYNNFVVINGKTFNGWNKDLIEGLLKELPPVPVKSVTVRGVEVEFEDEDEKDKSE